MTALTVSPHPLPSSSLMTAYFSEKSGTNKTLTASRRTSQRSKSGRKMADVFSSGEVYCHQSIHQQKKCD
ncbi:hypothetical protein DPMN_114636 [Dreissena polymorpha]|uniref:Uncharacterized protein n=1 Tax=Dreissena polymorpha TaxID=45954 RepID=A0A9D4KJW2_DREPO|nr:hypothetical protein DPMN_114636 [Dreissena polymorpha]